MTAALVARAGRHRSWCLLWAGGHYCSCATTISAGDLVAYWSGHAAGVGMVLEHA